MSVIYELGVINSNVNTKIGIFTMEIGFNTEFIQNLDISTFRLYYLLQLYNGNDFDFTILTEIGTHKLVFFTIRIEPKVLCVFKML